MKAVRSISLLLILFLSGTVFGQDYRENIDTTLKEYINLVSSNEFEKVLDYIEPEFFEHVDREQMISVMRSTSQNPSLEFEIVDMRVLDIGDSIHIDKKAYSKVTYTSQVHMKIKKEEWESDEDYENRLSQTKGYFDQSLGQDNVNYEPEENIFKIQSVKVAYAISPLGRNEWKFIEYNEKQKTILEKILPEELIGK